MDRSTQTRPGPPGILFRELGRARGAVRVLVVSHDDGGPGVSPGLVLKTMSGDTPESIVEGFALQQGDHICFEMEAIVERPMSTAGELEGLPGKGSVGHAVLEEARRDGELHASRAWQAAVAKRIAAKPASVYQELVVLTNRGLVERVSRGVYRLCDALRDASSWPYDESAESARVSSAGAGLDS